MRAWIIMLLLCVSAPAYAGYSHYWKWVKPPDTAELRACLKEMTQVLTQQKSILAGPDGKGDVQLTDISLVINGIGSFANEPFEFPSSLSQLNSCKTNWKAYDAVVIACLLIARDHFSEEYLVIFSDGAWPGDWGAGKQVYMQALQREAKNPLSDAKKVFSNPSEKQDDEDDDSDPSPVPQEKPSELVRMLVILGILGIIFLIWRSSQRH